jgi:hypothetical protein
MLAKGAHLRAAGLIGTLSVREVGDARSPIRPTQRTGKLEALTPAAAYFMAPARSRNYGRTGEATDEEGLIEPPDGSST